MSTRGHWRTLIIGGGQAGLAVGQQLAARGEEFVVLDASARIGDGWRQRWESLRLFTPAQHDGLPGLPFPAARGTFPTRGEMADYLEAYAARFSLPVRSGVQVQELLRTDEGRFEVRTGQGRFTADRVVLATGTNPIPRVPEFAGQLSPALHQLHSSQYHNPQSLPPGDVLVVGAGTSGVELAVELAGSRQVFIAGRPTTHIPDPVFRYAGGLYWFLVSHLLTVRTPMGRKARPAIRRGGAPLIRVSVDDLERAGVVQVPRVTGVSEGRPLLADGRTLEVASVVWATGYRPDFSWVRFPIADESGWPAGPRGVSTVAPGLYFVGMPFQFGLTSGLVGGVGRDAAFVAEQIHRRPVNKLSVTPARASLRA